MRTCSTCGARIEQSGDLWCAHCGATIDQDSAPDPVPSHVSPPPGADPPASVPDEIAEEPKRRTTAPAPSIKPTGIACISCGYDVSGTALGSTCPECGTPVMDSIPKPPPILIGADGLQRSPLPKSTAAGWSLGLGIASIPCCSPLGVIAIVLGAMALRDMSRGTVDPSSRPMAQIGIVFGVVGAVIFLIQAVAWSS